MKKRFVTLISVILSLCIAFSTMFIAFTTEVFAGTSGDLTWQFSENTGTLYINGNGKGVNYATYLSVPWRNSKDKITSVYVDEGVTGLGNCFFQGCTNLKFVSLPTTLNVIGKNCFYNCTSLSQIEIPQGCSIYGDACFSGCTSLKYINVPSNSTTVVPTSMFYNCSSLETISFGVDFASVEGNAIANCSSLNTVVWQGDSFSTESTADKVFDTSAYTNFYCPSGSQFASYIKSKRSSSARWKVYCIDNNHSYVDDKCTKCEKVFTSGNMSNVGEHNYQYLSKNGDELIYKCTHCQNVNHSEKIINLLSNFDFSYGQANKDSRFDVDCNGYVNSKDYAILNDMQNGVETGYEMTLSNKNATENTKALYKYIASVYEKGVITGQQESTWVGGADYEMNYIYSKTGKYPAIRGLDFMGDDFYGCVSRAKEWHNRGGIVSICWHCSNAFDKSYDNSKADNFPSDNVFVKGTKEYNNFIKGMKKAGDALKQLQDAGVPVLWRPFHEFDGKWFWWGKGGPEKFKQLWQMMYDYYTNDLGLNNLIWVLGYSHNGFDGDVNSSEKYTNMAAWYPGDDYCDIVGADSYEVGTNGGEKRLYNPVKTICKNTKPVVLHECGKIPYESQFKNTKWGWFLTWHTNYLTDSTYDGKAGNTTESLNKIYNSDWAITLDELPQIYK